MPPLCGRGGGGGDTGGRCLGGRGRGGGGGGGGTSDQEKDSGWVKRKRDEGNPGNTLAHRPENDVSCGGVIPQEPINRMAGEANGAKNVGKGPDGHRQERNISCGGGTPGRRIVEGEGQDGKNVGKGSDEHVQEHKKICCGGRTPGGKSGAIFTGQQIFTDTHFVLRGLSEVSPSVTLTTKSDRRNGSDHVRKELNFSEEEQENIHMKLHQLLLCNADMSQKFNIHMFLKGVQRVVRHRPTPGALKHVSLTTGPEVKQLVREIYILLKSLHKAGYYLDGLFTIDHFVLDEAKSSINVRFGYLDAEAFKKWFPDGESSDIRCFKEFVRRDVMKGETVPHDINLWLSILGDKDIEPILRNHVCLMSIQKAGDCFSSCYDTFANLENTQPVVHQRIVTKLSKYNGWQKYIKGIDANDLLERTFVHVDPKCKPYDDTVVDLLRLLRNSRQHESRSQHRYFALIVGQNFPNLISDLQIELFKEGCITD